MCHGHLQSLVSHSFPTSASEIVTLGHSSYDASLYFSLILTIYTSSNKRSYLQGLVPFSPGKFLFCSGDFFSLLYLCSFSWFNFLILLAFFSYFFLIFLIQTSRFVLRYMCYLSCFYKPLLYLHFLITHSPLVQFCGCGIFSFLSRAIMMGFSTFAILFFLIHCHHVIPVLFSLFNLSSLFCSHVLGSLTVCSYLTVGCLQLQRRFIVWWVSLQFQEAF